MIKDYAVIWTVMPIIFADCVPPMQDKFQLQSPPPLDKVMQHIQHLSTDVLDNWSHSKTITDTFDELLDFLQNNWSKLDKASQKKLLTMNLLPIEERRLAKPCRMYFKLKENLGPFMYQIPIHFYKYEKMLKVRRRCGVMDVGYWSEGCPR